MSACRHPLRSHGLTHAVVEGVSGVVTAAAGTPSRVRHGLLTGCARTCGKPRTHGVTRALTTHSRGVVVHRHSHAHDDLTPRRITAGRGSHGTTHGTHTPTHSRFRPPLYRGAERVARLR